MVVYPTRSLRGIRLAKMLCAVSVGRVRGTSRRRLELLWWNPMEVAISARKKKHGSGTAIVGREPLSGNSLMSRADGDIVNEGTFLGLIPVHFCCLFERTSKRCGSAHLPAGPYTYSTMRTIEEPTTRGSFIDVLWLSVIRLCRA